MKELKKSFQLITTLILFVFAIASVINITYSYFSTANKTNGNVEFGDLQVKFSYIENGETKDNAGNTINLYSASSAIEIGTPFELSTSVGGSPITMLQIANGSNSCGAYIRFWIDAYIVDGGNVNKTVNYGKYFLLDMHEDDYYTNLDGSVSGSTCYFSKIAIGADEELEIGNKLTLVNAEDNALAEILGKTLQISLSFEAVQSANKAYLSVFGGAGDTKGYYEYWS